MSLIEVSEKVGLDRSQPALASPQSVWKARVFANLEILA